MENKVDKLNQTRVEEDKHQPVLLFLLCKQML